VIISRNDPVAFGKWADKAAKGEVTIEFSD
jgi:hypothetical protein